MSTQTSNDTVAEPEAPQPVDLKPSSLGDIKPISFAALLRVEMRKQLDTRSGQWLLLAVGIIAVIVLIVTVFVDTGSWSWMTFFNNTSQPLLLLIPVIAILAATSEWSNKTAMTTFALEPRRARVMWAKVITSLVLGMGLLLFIFLLAAPMSWIGSQVQGVDANFEINTWFVWGFFAAMAISMLLGSAFGLALMNAPVAIVSYFIFPTLLTVAGFLITSIQEFMSWIDINATLTPLILGVEPTGEEWQKIAVSSVVWIVIPLAIGFWRSVKREVK